jgi:hypothetical protein
MEQMATSVGSKPGVKALDREVARVPKTRIGEGAKPGPNDGTQHINKPPKFGSSERGAKPGAKALESQVNAVRGGRKNSSAKSAGGFDAKRAAIRGKKKA